MGGVVALVGLTCGVLLAAAGALGARRSAQALLFRRPDAAALAGVLIAVLPAVMFAGRAAVTTLQGAAIGVAVGAVAAEAFVAAVAARVAARVPSAGARRFAVAAAAAAAAMIAAAFDGRVTRLEGGLMTAAAVGAAVLFLRARRAVAPGQPAGPSRPLAFRFATLCLGLGVLFAGAGLALAAARGLALRKADWDLALGLTVLGSGAALPVVAEGWKAGRRGDEAGFTEVAAVAAVTLFGAVGVAALCRPLTVPETFLHAPVTALAAAVLALLFLAFVPGKPPRGAVALGVLLYGGSLVAFARSAG